MGHQLIPLNAIFSPYIFCCPLYHHGWTNSNQVFKQSITLILSLQFKGGSKIYKTNLITLDLSLCGTFWTFGVLLVAHWASKCVWLISHSCFSPVPHSPQQWRRHCGSCNFCSPDPHHYRRHPLLLLPFTSQEEVREGNLQRDQVLLL